MRFCSWHGSSVIGEAGVKELYLESEAYCGVKEIQDLVMWFQKKKLCRRESYYLPYFI